MFDQRLGRFSALASIVRGYPWFSKSLPSPSFFRRYLCVLETKTRLLRARHWDHVYAGSPESQFEHVQHQHVEFDCGHGVAQNLGSHLEQLR